MFQFTREFIINDNEGKLEGGVKFLAKNGTLYVDNMVNVRSKDVNAIYRHDYEADAKDKVTITPTSLSGKANIKAGNVVRLVITLGKIGQTTATFNDYYPEHSRHLFYEAIAATDGTLPVDGLISSVEHEATLRGEKFVKIEKVGSDLVIEGLDCYTVVKEVRIVTLPQATPAAKIGALLTGYEDWELVADWTRKDQSATVAAGIVLTTAAKEGNGNTVQILKNMRLLTDANLNPYGIDMDERPLPKGKYDQYTVELVTERRHIGHDVMGSVGTSLTTLVFYVLKSGECAASVSEDFADELAKIGTIVRVAKSADTAAPKQVLAHANDVAAAVPAYTEDQFDSAASFNESDSE